MMEFELSLDHCKTLTLFFNHSLTDLQLCLGSLSYCMTKFGSSFSCQTDGLRFDSVLWYSEDVHVGSGAKVLWLQNKSKSLSLHQSAWQVALEVCADMLWLVLCMCLTHYAQTLYFCLVCPRDIVLEVLVYSTSPNKKTLFSHYVIGLS